MGNDEEGLRIQRFKGSRLFSWFLCLCLVVLPSLSILKEVHAVTIDYTIPIPSVSNVRNVIWSDLANGDIGNAYTGLGRWDTATIQVTGTFGVGGNVRIEASNDTGTPTWYTVTNITSAGITVVNAGYYQIRPNITAGDGTTDLTVTMVVTASTPDAKNLDDLLDVVIANPLNLHVPQYNSTTNKFENTLCNCAGGGAVAGSDTWVQYNLGGTAFGAEAAFAYTAATNTLVLGALDLTTPLADADVADNITLTNLTQITTKSHTSLTDIGTLSHATIDSYLDQSVKIASSPVFTSLRLDNSAYLKWRNAGNTADLNILTVTGADDTLLYGQNDLYLAPGQSGTGNIRITGAAACKVGHGVAPTAWFHIKAGTATAETAPLKFVAGTNLTTPEAGAMEFSGTDLFITDSTPTRHGIISHITDASDPHGTTLTQTNLALTGTFDISNTAPAITLTDTTASAKSLKVKIDGNKAYLQELAGADGSLLTLDLTNNYLGVNQSVPNRNVHIKWNDIGYGPFYIEAFSKDMVALGGHGLAYIHGSSHGDGTNRFQTGIYVTMRDDASVLGITTAPALYGINIDMKLADKARRNPPGYSADVAGILLSNGSSYPMRGTEAILLTENDSVFNTTLTANGTSGQTQITLTGTPSDMDDYYNDAYITTTGGNGKITDYNGTTKVATINFTLSASFTGETIGFHPVSWGYDFSIAANAFVGIHFGSGGTNTTYFMDYGIYMGSCVIDSKVAVVIPNNCWYSGRNAAGSADINIAKVNASNAVELFDGLMALSAGGVSLGTITPDASALLTLTSTTKGFLVPRLTTAQRNAISSPATGLEIYNTDYNKEEYYSGLKWKTKSLSRTYESDMLWTATAGHWWIGGGALVSGTANAGTPTENYPGFLNFASAATQTANTGFIIRTAGSHFKVSAGWYTEMIFQAGAVVTDTFVYFGFFNTTSATSPTKGCYIKIVGNGTNNILSGENIEAATSTTATSYTLVANTWYKTKIWVDNTISTITFQLLSATDAILWTDTLTTNIPTSAVHHGILAYELGAANPNESIGGTIISLDYMRLDL